MFLVVIAGLIVAPFVRQEVPSFEPTTDFARAPADGVVHDTVTLDARDGTSWVYFDFSTGRVIDGRVDPEWDIAFQRFHVITNGGDGYPGQAAALATTIPFDSILAVPDGEFEVTAGPIADEPANPALERWYDYSFFAHTLEPKPETYVIRTRDGQYAKVGILSYYCPEAMPGCFTFQYTLQPDGSTAFND